MKSQAHWFCAALASGLLLFVVDNQSFWIDETCSAIYAKQGSIAELAAFAKADSLAEPLQPLSVITNWTWSRISGTGEYALRSQNIVWGLLTMVAMAMIGQRLGLPWLPLLMAIQPFFWIYTNELRPYAGQITIGSWLALAVSMTFQAGAMTQPTWRILLGATLALMFSSVLAPLTLGPLFCLLALWVVVSKWPFRPLPMLTLLLITVCALGLGWYYIQVLRGGATGVRMWEISPLNLVYMVYEFCGSLGYGPGLAELREAYREGRLWDFLQTHQLAFALAGLHTQLVALLLLFGWIGLKSPAHRSLLLFGIVISSAVAITLWTVGYFTNKAFWARHLAPIFPFFSVAIGLALQGCFHFTSRLGIAARCLAILTLVAILGSSLLIGYGPAHVKSDVRQAAEIAREALDRQETVWWSGEVRAAMFYDLPVAHPSESTPLFVVNRGDAKDVDISSQPDLVVFSHREFFARWPAFIQALTEKYGPYHIQEFPGFKILRRSTASVSP